MKNTLEVVNAVNLWDNTYDSGYKIRYIDFELETGVYCRINSSINFNKFNYDTVDVEIVKETSQGYQDKKSFKLPLPLDDMGFSMAVREVLWSMKQGCQHDFAFEKKEEVECYDCGKRLSED